MSVSLCLPPPLFFPPGCFLSCLLLFPAIPLSLWMCFSLWLADVCVISRTVPPCFSLSLLPSRECGELSHQPTLLSACFRPHRGVQKSKSDCLLFAFLPVLFWKHRHRDTSLHNHSLTGRCPNLCGTAEHFYPFSFMPHFDWLKHEVNTARQTLQRGREGSHSGQRVV